MTAIPDLQAKAAVLIEALPYLQRYAGEILVVKYGGHAMTDPESAASFARDVVLLRSVGFRVVVVHGGGPQIGAELKRAGIVSTFKQGLRVTDDDTMRVVRRVLVGEVAQEIVARIHQAGGRAVGLSGADGGLLRGRRLLLNGEDIGRVGEIVQVDDTELRLLTGGGFIPVISPIAIDADGEPLNVNADSAAGVIAGHLQARKLLLMTDVAGVLDRDGELMANIARERVEALIADGVLTGGMIPKMQCALDALARGTRAVHIIDGRLKHALLLELFTDRGVGTEVI
ncbi:MAG: acetylglutamate kinase [Myxococcales bacterium]|nr:acetylglutamate kinase [Myxococcales bacterium]